MDALSYTRELKAMGVNVFFINDGINTATNDGELRLTIMSSMALDKKSAGKNMFYMAVETFWDTAGRTEPTFRTQIRPKR